MRQIRLYGELGRQFGRIHYLAVKNTAEAIRALCSNFDDFERAILETAPGYRIWCGSVRLSDTDQLHDPSGAADVIKIAPVMTGSKGALGQILVGAALIAASFIPGLNVAVWSGAAMTWSSVAFSVGLSLTLGGIAQLLSPTPKLNSGSGESTENMPSYVFNGATNTTAQGHPVPVGYGEMIIGSAVISAGLYAKDIATTKAAGAPVTPVVTTKPRTQIGGGQK